MTTSAQQSLETLGWTLSEWCQQQRAGGGLERLQTLLEALNVTDDTAWITLLSASDLAEQWQQLEHADAQGARLPLWGVPIAVKDNIDVVGFSTTAACPAAAYTPSADASVIRQLRSLGAIIVGKTNLDQFATGLVGTRSPYGAVPNSVDSRYVSGGSSSGSASVVARGLVPLALGTDTAGSGRVPAGFNNIVGLKPTRGRLSTNGVLPACRSVDCVSIFALSVEDAEFAAQLLSVYDADDVYSRQNPYTAPVDFSSTPRFGVPDTLRFFGDTQAQAAFEQALERLRGLGVELVEIPSEPFDTLAEQLYQGPWVAERTAALETLLRAQPEAIDPSVREIVAQGHRYSAVDAYRAEYRRAELKQRIDTLLAPLDAMVVPTSPTIRTIAEMAEQPIAYNAQFGTYTNFTNLADLSALALPADFRADGLPAGITLIAPAWHDTALAAFGKRWQRALALPLGATQRPYTQARPALPEADVASGAVTLAVVGAHLTGKPLNYQLTQRNATLLEQTTTAARYRLYALSNTTPPKPGLARAAAQQAGAEIVVELWQVPLARFGEFVAEVPAPLGIGNVELADGRWVKGFICEAVAQQDAEDITAYGGWRAFQEKA
ncbi:Allophanate hydrolase [Carnimonas sp. R-84981]|uniref:allophanate hydrolase n=1 Tax=Carnimonas bestiolae TaxID=3402172 RepID=UPI003EDC8C24